MYARVVEIQAWTNELYIQYLHYLNTNIHTFYWVSLHRAFQTQLDKIGGKNLMRSWVVPCHVPNILFLAGRLHRGGFQTLTEQILSLLFVSHLDVLSLFFSDRNWPLMIFCYALSRVVF